jgi:hypothetical protein
MIRARTGVEFGLDRNAQTGQHSIDSTRTVYKFTLYFKDFCGKASTMDFTTAVDWFKDELRSLFSGSFLPPDRPLLPMSASPLPTLQAPYMKNSLHISTKTPAPPTFVLHHARGGQHNGCNDRIHRTAGMTFSMVIYSADAHGL